MGIFRRRPKFKVGDRVEVNSLFNGLAWMDRCHNGFLRGMYVGQAGEVVAAWPAPSGRRCIVRMNGDPLVLGFSEWELRHA